MTNSYYDNPRPEIAALVPAQARAILDVGCGRGILGSSLKVGRPDRKVTGIEIMPDVAEEAKKSLDQIIIGDVTTLALPIAQGSMDCIICADILEHVLDPAALLKKLAAYLSPQGCLITSIPNMRHYTVILRLIRRGWEYDDFGHFDRTHLRFFSRKTMVKLLEDAGFVLDVTQPRIVASKKMRIINALLMHRLEEFMAMQYIFRATRP
jgi:O-antigen biosynthesis protein